MVYDASTDPIYQNGKEVSLRKNFALVTWQEPGSRKNIHPAYSIRRRKCLAIGFPKY